MDGNAREESQHPDEGRARNPGFGRSCAAALRARADAAQVAGLLRALNRLPGLDGRAVEIRFVPGLRAWRGRLLSGGARGEIVHAGSQMRKRRMVLDASLLAQPGELTRIFLHELFHFVWLRAGNGLRRSYEALLEREFRCRARGELGWSAEWRKRGLTARHRIARSRRWRDYVCESFCDSAAWLLGTFRRHNEFTLAPRFRQARRNWFQRHVLGRRISV